MSTERCFLTEEQQKAKNWDMLAQYRAEKAELARLENELDGYVSGWRTFVDAFRDRQGKRFQFENENVIIFQRRLSGELKPRKIGSLSLNVLNEQSLRKLISNINRTRKTVAELGQQLKALGVSD